MRVVDAISQILKREGVGFSCLLPNQYPDRGCRGGGDQTVDLSSRKSRCRHRRRLSPGSLMAGALACLRCRQGPARKTPFQASLLPTPTRFQFCFYPSATLDPLLRFITSFRSTQSYATVTKWTEEIALASHTSDVMRRAFSHSENGPAGTRAR